MSADTEVRNELDSKSMFERVFSTLESNPLDGNLRSYVELIAIESNVSHAFAQFTLAEVLRVATQIRQQVAGVATGDFGRDKILNQIAQQSRIDLELSDAERETLTNRLIMLAGTPHVIATVKALTLLQTGGKNVRGTKLLTDVRPIFSANLEEIEVDVLRIMLSIQFSEDGQQSYSSIALNLDFDQFYGLYQELVRAVQKMDVIRKASESAGRRFIGIPAGVELRGAQPVDADDVGGSQ
jgi:hypothetical protein